MATTKDEFHALSPGLIGLLRRAEMHIPVDDIVGGRMASHLIAKFMNKVNFPILGTGIPYSVDEWTTTLTGTGAAVATNGQGVLITAGSSSTFNSNLESKATVTTPAAGWYSFVCAVRCSDITAVGFSLGFGNSQVDPNTTDYTDGIYFRKAPTTATVTGRVRGNSGTAAATGTMATMVNDTWVFFGFSAYMHATTPAGFFWTGTTDSLTKTDFTSAQLVQLAAILTTPPALFMNLSAKGSAGNPTISVRAFGEAEA